MEASIGKLHINYSFKYRYTKIKEDGNAYEFERKWRDWKIGIWFRKNLIVGRKDFNMPKNWAKNMVNSYTFGMDLLIIKMWVGFSYNGKQLGN